MARWPLSSGSGPVGESTVWKSGPPYGYKGSIRLDVTTKHDTTFGFGAFGNVFSSNMLIAYLRAPRVVGNPQVKGRFTCIWDDPGDSHYFNPVDDFQGWRSWTVGWLEYTNQPSPNGGPSWTFTRGTLSAPTPPPPRPTQTLSCVPIPTSLHVYLNGAQQREGVDWTMSVVNNEAIVTLTEAVEDRPGDLLECRYACEVSP